MTNSPFKQLTKSFSLLSPINSWRGTKIILFKSEYRELCRTVLSAFTASSSQRRPSRVAIVTMFCRRADAAMLLPCLQSSKTVLRIRSVFVQPEQEHPIMPLTRRSPSLKSGVEAWDHSIGIIVFTWSILSVMSNHRAPSDWRQISATLSIRTLWDDWNCQWRPNRLWYVASKVEFARGHKSTCILRYSQSPHLVNEDKE